MTCLLCSVAQKHVPVKIVYEDSICIAYIPHDAATAGHLSIIPKQHVEAFEELSEEHAIQFFYVASYAASAVYEGLGSQGTNILCNNGQGAGAKEHLILHVVPRKEGDTLSFQWEPKSFSPAEFEDILRKIKDKTDYISVKKEEKIPTQPLVSVPLEQSPSEEVAREQKPELLQDEENYMVRHLQRIP